MTATVISLASFGEEAGHLTIEYWVDEPGGLVIIIFQLDKDRVQNNSLAENET